MATREYEDELLKKAEPLTAIETDVLTAAAGRLKTKHDKDVKRLAQLRKKNGLDATERTEVDAIRQKIGPEIKRAANMDRKTGRPVEPVW
jgi:hypothetical protein